MTCLQAERMILQLKAMLILLPLAAKLCAHTFVPYCNHGLLQACLTASMPYYCNHGRAALCGCG